MNHLQQSFSEITESKFSLLQENNFCLLGGKKMLNLYTIFLHLHSILVPTPMAELAALFYTPYLLKLLTIFSWITSEKIIRSLISSVMKCFFFSFGVFFKKRLVQYINIYFIHQIYWGWESSPITTSLGAVKRKANSMD